MGSKGAKLSSSGKLSMDNLQDLLGEAMPDIPKNRVGLFRLMRALKGRFGNDFKNLPGIKDPSKVCDVGVKFEGQISKMKGIKRK